MSDDKKNRGRTARARINVNEPCELAYWTRERAVSEKTLREPSLKSA